jgi:FkbM family methyltransferase
MNKIKLWHTLGRVKRSLDRYGLTRLSLAMGGAGYVKHRWFREFDEQSQEGVWATLNGLKVCMPPRFIAHYVLQEYEELTQRTFRESVQKGNVVVDIGAHIGYYSLLAARLVGETGTVHAVEPCHETTAFLQKSIQANRFTNIAVHSCAAGSRHGLREFQITGSSDSHGFYRHPNTGTVRTVEVMQEPLDGIIEGRVDIVKIDVEGAEIEVLEGMRDILMHNRKLALWAEWFPAGMQSAGRSPSELPERLRSLGFQQIRVIDDIAKTICPVEDVAAAVSAGLLPKSWYANLWARHGTT